MSFDPVINFGKVTLNTGYDQNATSVVLVSGDGAKLPNPGTDGAFNLVWWNATDYSDPTDDPNREIVRATGKSTDTLTISRAQEGTSASTKNTATKVYQMILAVTAKTITDLRAAFPSVPTWTKETPSGNIDGVNTQYTITQIPIADSGTLFLNQQPLTEGIDYNVDITHKKINMTTPIPSQLSTLPFVFKYQY